MHSLVIILNCYLPDRVPSFNSRSSNDRSNQSNVPPSGSELLNKIDLDENSTMNSSDTGCGSGLAGQQFNNNERHQVDSVIDQHNLKDYNYRRDR